MTSNSSIISEIPDTILGLGNKTRFCGIIDSLGNVLYFKYREDVPDPLFPETEVEKDVVRAIAQMQKDNRRTNLIGIVKFCVISFEKIARAIIPLGELFVLISFDGSTSNLDTLMREKILPLLISRTSALA
jgi:hypothetical protein